MNDIVSPRTVVITGASQGLGARTSILFRQRGDSVWNLDRKAPEKPAPDGPVFFEADVCDPSSLANAVAAITEKSGFIDVWINNAGYGKLVDFAGADGALWEDIFEVNFRGVVNCCRAVLPALRRPGGVIINIASVAALMAPRRHSAYAVSKAGVIALTRSLAIDHAGEGIRVNAIAPGPLDTDGFRAAGGDPAKRSQTIPTRRMVQTEEIARACAFLADPLPSLTGHTLVIDGGCTAAGCYI